MSVLLFKKTTVATDLSAVQIVFPDDLSMLAIILTAPPHCSQVSISIPKTHLSFCARVPPPCRQCLFSFISFCRRYYQAKPLFVLTPHGLVEQLSNEIAIIFGYRFSDFFSCIHCLASSTLYLYF